MRRFYLLILTASVFSCRENICPSPVGSGNPTTHTLTLQPDAAAGKDAYIWYTDVATAVYGDVSSINYGPDPEFPAMEWTWDGSPGRRNGLIEFDLTSIPSNAKIISAKLSLYGCPTCGDPGHYNGGTGNENEGLIQRVTSPWDESTVTWNTRPSVTSQNQVVIPASTSVGEDYLDIDIKNLVQDIVANPSTSHGFMVSMQISNYYRRLIFASSDHSDSTKHPKLVVQYQ